MDGKVSTNDEKPEPLVLGQQEQDGYPASDSTSLRRCSPLPQPSRENSANSISLLAGLEELLESTSSTPAEIFTFDYRGSSAVDKHYTKPMLPWIITEIKDQRKYEKVRVFFLM